MRVPHDVPRLLTTESPHYRASFFLCFGSVVMMLGGLVNFMFSLPFPISADFLTPYFSWSLWVAALFILGSGFLWIGNAPGFSRLGWYVAFIHVVNAFGLLILIIPVGMNQFSPEFLTIGRLLSLLLFAFGEKSIIPTPTLVLLVSISTLQILKIILRLSHVLPEVSHINMLLLDTSFLLVMAAALFLLGVSFLEKELDQDDEETMSLVDFNNPEHPWNEKTKVE